MLTWILVSLQMCVQGPGQIAIANQTQCYIASIDNQITIEEVVDDYCEQYNPAIEFTYAWPAANRLNGMSYFFDCNTGLYEDNGG